MTLISYLEFCCIYHLQKVSKQEKISNGSFGISFTCMISCAELQSSTTYAKQIKTRKGCIEIQENNGKHSLQGYAVVKTLVVCVNFLF